MKTTIKSAGILKISLAASLLIFTSCTKHTVAPEAPPATTGVISLHLHTGIGMNEVDSGTIAMDANGRNIQLNIAQFYISGVILKKTDGNSVTLDTRILKTIGEEMYVLGTVPAGNYSSISFNIGVDAANNSKDPAMCSASDPLHTQTPSMWFGSTSQGYMFMNVQGLADTSAAQNAPVSSYMPFCYQLGTNAMFKTVNMPVMSQPVSVTAKSTQNSPAMIHVMCDYGKLLEGIDFKTQSCGTPFNGPTVANHVAGNVASMFMYN
ncbi:MAG: MbnP family protein [Bacteroidia bacterium]